jgi:hypothetical protein
MGAEPVDLTDVPSGPPPEGWRVADVDAVPNRDGVRYQLVDGVPRVPFPITIDPVALVR